MVKRKKKSKWTERQTSYDSKYKEDKIESFENYKKNDNTKLNLMTTDQKKYHFFWKSGSPFSQWHPSVYTLDGITYANAEQGMMHGKALLFQDEEVAEAILLAQSPRKMKALGRTVRGFKEKVWENNRLDLVYRNNVAKFTQNPHLKEALLSTTGLLVEASPSDAIWGIGINEEKAKTMDPSCWRGLNLLGKTLTKVRQDLQAQENVEKDEPNEKLKVAMEHGELDEMVEENIEQDEIEENIDKNLK